MKLKSAKKSAQPDPKLAMDTLAVALKDIYASQCLYEKECYPQAIFFLQQGIEKGWKAFGYHHGLLTLSEAKSKEYNHMSTNVGKSSLIRMRNIIGHMVQQLKIVQNFYSQVNEEINESDISLKNMYEDLIWAQKAIDKATEPSFVITPTELQSMLDKFHGDEQAENNCEEIIESPEMCPKIIKQVRDGAINELNVLFSGIPIADELINDISQGKFDDQKIKDILLSVMKGMVIVNPLFYFAIMTQRHENICRYPDKIRSPLNEYTKDHIIIRFFPAIAHTTQNSLEKMDELFRMDLFQPAVL